jgi:ABC-type Fe3+-siderophore transport system permease subunit
MTANRVAALVAVAASVVTGVLIPLLDVIRNPYAQAAVIVACILAATAIVIVWLIGWQKHEANVALTTNATIDHKPTRRRTHA